jgi:hypothetical protein
MSECLGRSVGTGILEILFFAGHFLEKCLNQLGHNDFVTFWENGECGCGNGCKI